jgi:hypothetical protein
MRRRHVYSNLIEYGVTLAELERAYAKVLARIKRERCKGSLKPWRP